MNSERIPEASDRSLKKIFICEIGSSENEAQRGNDRTPDQAEQFEVQLTGWKVLQLLRLLLQVLQVRQVPAVAGAVHRELHQGVSAVPELVRSGTLCAPRQLLDRNVCSSMRSVIKAKRFRKISEYCKENSAIVLSIGNCLSEDPSVRQA